MAATTLHYIFDPFCGWCYAASPLIAAASEIPSLNIVFHAGGMLCDEHRTPITPQFRQFVMQHDERIKNMTGLPFGDAYINGLLNNHTVILDSQPPITAILAAQSINQSGLRMIQRLQRAFYVDGMNITEHHVLVSCASDIGLNSEAFTHAYDSHRDAITRQHISNARQFLRAVGARGFPTLVLQNDNTFSVIDIGPWLGKPAAFAAWLTQQTPIVAPSTAALCDLDGCH